MEIYEARRVILQYPAGHQFYPSQYVTLTAEGYPEPKVYALEAKDWRTADSARNYANMFPRERFKVMSLEIVAEMTEVL